MIYLFIVIFINENGQIWIAFLDCYIFYLMIKEGFL